MKTPKEMFQVLRALDDDVSIKLTSMANPHWYVAGRWEISHDGMLESVSGYADTPEQAIINVYDKLTEQDTIVVLNANTDKRKALTWRGFMWQDVS